MLESPASTLALRNQLRLSRPGSYYFSAGGGLGFGLAASVGVQLAQPDRPVVCVLGEGSAQYAITAFWSAAAYKVPVTFLVLRNEEYAILKWFAEVEQVRGRARPRPARARRRRGRRGLRRHRDPGEGSRRGARRLGEGARLLASPSWSKSRSRPGCRSSKVRHGAAGERRLRPHAAARRAGARPRARRGRRRHGPAAARRARGAARRRPRPRTAPATSSATPPTPAPTGCCRRRW